MLALKFWQFSFLGFSCAWIIGVSHNAHFKVLILVLYFTKYSHLVHPSPEPLKISYHSTSTQTPFFTSCEPQMFIFITPRNSNPLLLFSWPQKSHHSRHQVLENVDSHYSCNPSVQPHQNSKGAKDIDNKQYLERNLLMANKSQQWAYYCKQIYEVTWLCCFIYIIA